jgi:hypothetical protein
MKPAVAEPRSAPRASYTTSTDSTLLGDTTESQSTIQQRPPPTNADVSSAVIAAVVQALKRNPEEHVTTTPFPDRRPAADSRSVPIAVSGAGEAARLTRCSTRCRKQNFCRYTRRPAPPVGPDRGQRRRRHSGDARRWVRVGFEELEVPVDATEREDALDTFRSRDDEQPPLVWPARGARVEQHMDAARVEEGQAYEVEDELGFRRSSTISTSARARPAAA